MTVINSIIAYWLKGGWLMIPLAIVCLCIWYFFLKMNLKLKKILKEAAPVESVLQQSLKSKKSISVLIIELAKTKTLTADLIVYVIEKVKAGYPLLDVFYEVKQKEFAPYEYDLTILKALVVAAPLLGLLGTVMGMISTFQAIAEKSSDTAVLMSSGISQGLLTTEFGLIIAIPGLFGLSLIKKKMEQWEGQLTAIQFHLAEGMNF